MKENKRISIVTAYYNRRKLFYNTLKTIEQSKHKDLVEIIVVDDASNDNNRIDDFPDLFDLDIKIIRIEKEDKWWINPCIPFNIGFKEAKGDIIIIQNPECVHYGDVIKSVIDDIDDNLYLNFACYSTNEYVTNNISNLDLSKTNYTNLIGKLIFPLDNRPVKIDGETAWYNHSKHRPHMLHFCSAINKKDLDELNGFDEKYANGIAYDDNDFLLRIQRKNMNIKIIDTPFVIHQFHGVTQYGKNQELVRHNAMIYQNTLKNIK